MTQAKLLQFILERARGVNTITLIKQFGEEIQQTVYDLVELGLIYEYTDGRGSQTFGVCRRWRGNDSKPKNETKTREAARRRPPSPADYLFRERQRELSEVWEADLYVASPGVPQQFSYGAHQG